MRRVFLDDVLHFGTYHKGKTLRQVYTGVIGISDLDIQTLFRSFEDKVVPNRHNIHVWRGLLGREVFDEQFTTGGAVLLKHLPDPGYVGYLVCKTNELCVSPEDLEELQLLEIHTLLRVRFESVGGQSTLTPEFTVHRQEFSPEVFATARERMARIFPRMSRTIVEDDYEFDDGSSFGRSGGQCPACGEPSPCSCNYQLDQTT